MRSSWIRFRWVGALLVAGVLLALIAGHPGRGGPAPLDPGSYAPDGTRALVMLLQAEGAQVQTGAPGVGDAQAALLLQDELSSADRGRLGAWVRAGHTLVVADPSSELAGVRASTPTGEALALAGGATLTDRHCPLQPIAAVQELRPGGGTLMQTGIGGTECFVSSGDAYVIARALGDGTVVTIGGPDLWENQHIAAADNSVLAVSLLAPLGGTHVALLGASPVGSGRTHLLSLIPSRVWEMLGQLAVAFGLLVLWRGRRLGRPVPDPVPVRIDASELTLAVGRVMQAGGHRGKAAAALRRAVGATTSRRLGLPKGSPPTTVAAVTAARTGLDEQVVLSALAGGPPATDEDLVNLAVEVHRIQEEIARAR